MQSIPEILSSPLALLPSAATALLEAYRAEYLHGHPPVHAYDPSNAASPELKLYDLVEGVAIIPVQGVLVHGEAYSWYGEMSYSSIAGRVAAAMVDQDVRGIALHVNSPGGTVSGCFDLCDALYDLRGSKPIWSIVDEAAYSAAYAIACCADKILVPRTGGVGSVGVITMHVDITKMLEEFGVKVTTIQFGERKSDGYPTTPLSKEARQRMQADVDSLGDMFVKMVSRNRGIDASTVRETEAGCFLGEEGVKAGFADAVMSVEQAIMEFIDVVNK